MIQRISYLILVICFFGETACISFSLFSSKSAAYEKIVLSTPDAPYSELKISSADRSWQNPRTGNTISYMSSCNMSSEPTLEVLSSMALDGVESLKIIQQSKVNFNGREALNTTLIGRVDGVPVQADLTVLKKNNCVFNLTYIGSINSFMADLPIFKKFYREFKIL